MSSVSISQRRFFGGVKGGAIPKPKGMTMDQVTEFASTPEKGLPKHAPATHFADGTNGHWMAAAFAHNKGGLHRATNTPAGQKIPEKKITAALHSKDPHKVHMAQAAKNAR